jgi:uncharacterized protein YjbI with pentapeptide repeats
MSNMRKVTQEELDQILADHALWLEDDSAGVQANLSHTNLTAAKLINANFTGINLTGTRFAYAILTGAKFGLNIIDAASIYRATFSKDALIWLILRGDWGWAKDTVKIVDDN